MWPDNKYRYGDKTFRRKEFDAPFSRRYNVEREYAKGNNWKNSGQHRRSNSPNFARSHNDRSPSYRQSYRRQRYTENRAVDGYHRRGAGENSERKHGWHRKERWFSPSKARYRSPSIGNANYDTKPRSRGNQSNYNADKRSRTKDERHDDDHYGSTDKDEGAATPNYERYLKSSSAPNNEKIPVGSELQTMGHEQGPEASVSVSNCSRYSDAGGPTRMRQTYFVDEGDSAANHKRYLADPDLHTMSQVQMADARNRQNDVLLDSVANLASESIIKMLQNVTVIDENAKIKNEFEANRAIDNNTDLNVIAYPLDEQHFVDANGYILNTMDVLNECERIGATVTSVCYKYIPVVTEIRANISTEFGVEEKHFWARKGLYAAHNEL